MSAQLSLPNVPVVEEALESESEIVDTDELKTRLRILEAALACVERECEAALREPEIALTSICRIDAVARQTLEPRGRADEN